MRDPRGLYLTLYKNCFDNQGGGFTIEPPSQLGTIIRPAEWSKPPKKTDLLCWSPARYHPGEKRSKSNVIDVSCVVYDIDEGSPFELHNMFSDFRYYAHTTYSHKPDYPKWRLILPLKKPVPGADWRRAWKAGRELFQGRTGCEIDGVCSDASRLYYIGTREAEEFSNLERGQYLDLDYSHIPEAADKPRAIPHVQKKAVYAQNEDKAVYMSLKTDPEARRKAAEALGADISEDGIARGMICPGCGRSDLWFAIDPTQKSSATCNHKNTCGYFINLYDLLLMEK